MDFMQAVKLRRSIYDLSDKLSLSNQEIENIVYDAVKHAPSAFNIQSAKVMLLFGEQHKKLWEITKEALRKVVPENSFSKTEAKINTFSAGAGTVLFFEDDSLTKKLQEQFPLYANNFPTWAEQANGIAQFAVWTALAEKGVGASLQHYNPLIDDAVKNEWDFAKNFRLIAQMPFGKIESEAENKQFDDKASRFTVIQ